MVKRFAGDAILIVFLLFFSWWLMSKSFGYDGTLSQFRVARHEVGDFGLHISLIRSFAAGNNNPIQSPFFPGRPLVYHYGVDWLAGQLVRFGIRIDYALNGVSALALTLLLYGLYRLAIFFSDGKILAGLLSVIFFVLPGNLSFIDMLLQAPKNSSFFSYVWQFPDYLHKGPFDGSVVTIYTTLAPYLNQRHLIAGLAIAVWIIWIATQWLKSKKRILDNRWALVGLVIGASTRVHVMVAAATAILMAVLLIGKRNRALLPMMGMAFLVALPHFIQIIFMKSEVGMSQTWNPGYLVARPLSITSWVSFWVYNLGILVILIPLGYQLISGVGRRLMVGAGVLFLIANTVQISYRLEHNHSLINYATVIMLPYIAMLVVTWWNKRNVRWKFFSMGAVFFMTASGIVNLMVVKNDYQLMVDDAPKNRLIQWAQTQTDPSSVFMAPPALYDPVTIAGRKNYLGHEYYVSVMGYDYEGRRKQIDMWLTNFNQQTITEMKNQHIDYIVIPTDKKDSPYTLDEGKMKTLIPVVYQDESVNIYEL